MFKNSTNVLYVQPVSVESNGSLQLSCHTAESPGNQPFVTSQGALGNPNKNCYCHQLNVWYLQQKAVHSVFLWIERLCGVIKLSGLLHFSAGLPNEDAKPGITADLQPSPPAFWHCSCVARYGGPGRNSSTQTMDVL